MRCRLILLITEHPIQQGIRKGGVRHFCDEDEDEDGRTRTDRMAYSRQLDDFSRSSDLPVMFICLRLASRALCQTASNASEISRKQA